MSEPTKCGGPGTAAEGVVNGSTAINIYRLFAVPAAAESVLVVQVRRHEPGVCGEDCTTVMTRSGHTLADNLCCGKAE